MILTNKNLFNEFYKYRHIINPFAAMCQCRHESFYKGKEWNSSLCKEANNLAGIKATKNWQGEVSEKTTWEQKPNGEIYTTVARFRKYPDIESFCQDYVDKINSMYPEAKASKDNLWGYFSGLIGKWATDLAYIDRLTEQAISMAPDFFGEIWREKLQTSFRYAVDKKLLKSGLESRIRAKLIKIIPNFENNKSKIEIKKTIVIDPGHGGDWPGAVNPNTKTRECDINLQFAFKLKSVLEDLSYYNVIMTRETDDALLKDLNNDLIARAKVANSNNAHAFISIHCNSATNSIANGFEVYSTKCTNNSDKLADLINNQWKIEMKEKSRGHKEANFTVIKNTNCPSVLVELLFISNSEDEKKLKDEAWQSKAAKVLASALHRFLA